MKEGWKVKKLGEVCEVIAGQSPEGTFYNKDGNGLPFYQGKKEFGEKLLGPPTTWTTLTTKIALEGDILMSVRAPVGPVNFAVDQICIGRGLAAIRSGDNLNQNFLFYQLLYLQPELSSTEGAVFASISKSAIQALPLALPPLSEQQSIVAKLDEAFDGIEAVKANTENNIKNARGIFENELNGIFTKKGEGWEEKSLVQIASAFGRGKSRYRPRNAPHLYGGNYPFIQTGDIRNADHNITQYSQSYSDAGLAQSKLWPKGTVCITIAANIAETGILSFDACFPDSVIGVTPNPKEADSGFLEYLLQYFRSHLQKMGKGSAQDNINMGTFEHQRFPFPPIDEQLHISKRLDSIRDESKRINLIYNHKLKKLDDLKKSLLHHAFTGNL